MAIAAGERIGPYEIQAPLGAGGMGEVYAAVDTRLRRRVAIKRLTGAADQPADLRRRAINEARAAAQLNHPNIAAVYDVLEIGDTALIVMEYVEGQTLAARLAQARPSFDDTARIVSDAAEALTAAHRAGVVHRDLKPANILLTPDGGVKILDFGLARITEARSAGPGGDLTTTATEVGQLAGTPAYMPPERILGRPVDHRGDIYSLGVVLFELLTGRLPFTAPDVMSLFTQIATQPAPAPSQIDPRIPPELDAITTRAMAADPAGRYATADALRADLLAYTSPPVKPGGAGAAPAARRRSASLPLAVTLLVLLAASAGAFVAWRFSAAQPPPSATSPTTVAVIPLSNETGDARNDHLGVGISDVIAAGLFSIRNVNVASCTAAADCPDAGRDPRKAAEDLGASLLVNGSVQRHDDDVSVALGLRDVVTDALLWTQQYTSPLSRLSDIQQQMNVDLAAALHEAGAATRTPDAAERATAAGATSNALAFEHYSQARLLLERPDIPGHASRAIKLLLGAIENDPGFALAHAALGQAYWLRYEETRRPAFTELATKAILEALRLDSSQPQVRLSLATIYLGTGELDKAAAEARRAVELQPHSDEAHRVLASILIEQGRSEAALEEARLALRLRPRFWRNLNQLGYIHYRNGRFDEAATAFGQSIELQPDNARSYHMLGSMYLAMGKPNEALGALRRANEIQPDARSLSNLGTIHYWAGRYDEAVAAYRHAVRLAPKEPVHYRNLGDALQRLGERREAADAYKHAVRAAEDLLKVSPRDANMRSMLAVYLAKRGDHRRAEVEIAQALEASPNSEEVWYRKAVVHALADDTGAAFDALEEALRRGASRPVAAQDEDLAPLKKDPRFEKLVG